MKDVMVKMIVMMDMMKVTVLTKLSYKKSKPTDIECPDTIDMMTTMIIGMVIGLGLMPTLMKTENSLSRFPSQRLVMNGT